MRTRQVHFPSSLDSTASAGKSSPPTDRQQALAQWWGDFVPIDQWTPPKVKPQFEGLEFRRYNMSPETRHDIPGGDLGDHEPGDYERAFAGVDEAIEELSAMFNETWDRNNPPASGLSTTTRSDEEEVDQLMGDDSPSYDLGWGALPAEDEADDGPAYDLGWTTLQDENEADDEPAYDLGWTSHPTVDVDAPGESMDHQADGPAADNIDNDDGPAYDLGWGESTSVNPGCPDVVKAPSDDDASTYDLGSGDAPASPEVIDLTSDDGPTYDLGWDMRPSSPLSPLDLSSGLLSPTPPSPGAMGVDIKVERASSLDDADEQSADEIMKHINRRLKAIGNNMNDEHAHAIVENAVHGLNYSRSLAHILMENRQLLGWFADARDRVTDVGQDMSQMHRLIHLQRRMLKTVNQVITSLETDGRE
ncbi:hypothetical protein CY34DRAFT_18462 [Suillus luteus UH-Slu-Lm8-n1]|uniref:Uncharacterized protein n=1 Tax=Suillus luteus UH-Slu-Lm8-n1 TaxID=930992 RepID=A0A0D0AGD2_9AGAM|nr:hypothetical protein CY34DRAFT_18462 [Suillus luteus UH-Slu-Lm8-n1]